MSFQKFQSATNHSWDVHERILKNYERKRLYGILKSITDSTNVVFLDHPTEIITDTILTVFKDSLQSLLVENSNKFAIMYGDRYGDSIDLNQYVSFGSKNVENISKRDFLYMDEGELATVYKNDVGWIERSFFKQKAKLLKDESQLSSVVIGKTTWTFLLMMPCLALVLFFMYDRGSYFYIEHLIFAFHLQSFWFLILAIFIAVMNIFPWWIFFVFFAVMWIYLFISMWKVYRESFGKTFIKFLFISVSYGGLFFLFTLGTIFISLFLL